MPHESLWPQIAASKLRLPHELGCLPQEGSCGFQGSKRTSLKKQNFIVLFSEAMRVYKIFLDCNLSCDQEGDTRNE